VITDTDSNSGTKSCLKASNIRNTKLSGALLDKDNTPDHSTLDKKMYAKYTTRKRGVSNTKD